MNGFYRVFPLYLRSHFRTGTLATSTHETVVIHQHHITAIHRVTPPLYPTAKHYTATATVTNTGKHRHGQRLLAH